MNRTFPDHLWFKSSYTTEQGQCVEVAMTPDAVGVRDSKNRAGGHFAVSAEAFAGFVDAVKRNDGWRGA